MTQHPLDEMGKRHDVNNEEETTEAEANQEDRRDDDTQKAGRNTDRPLDVRETSRVGVVEVVNTSQEDEESRWRGKAPHVGIAMDNAVGTNMHTTNAEQAAKLQGEYHNSQGNGAKVVALVEAAVEVEAAGAQKVAEAAGAESGSRCYGNESAGAETGTQDRHVCRNQRGHIHERLNIPAQVCNPSDRRNMVHENAYEEEDYATEEETRYPKDNKPAGCVRCLRFCFQTDLGQPNAMPEQSR